MKKFILLTMAIVLSVLSVAMARTLYVEKAHKVKVKGQKSMLVSGTTLNEDANIEMPADGVLIFVDKQSGNRWMVKKKFSGKIGKLAKPRKPKDLITASKSYFYNYSQPKNTARSTPGAVLGTPVPSQIGVGIGMTDPNEAKALLRKIQPT